MCCQSDKSVGLVSAINSLIQSAACVIFGIVAMLMYECILTPTPPQLSDASVMPSPLSAFSSSFYLQYFHSQNNCIAHNTYIWKDYNSTVTGVVTKSYQVHIIFIVYIVENGLWLLCTALLFFGTAIKSQWIYRAYSFVQFTVILYDAILIVLFGLDFKSYREFQGNTKVPLITKSSMLVNIIVMLLIVSRFVFFFILNIVLSCYIHKSASRMNPKISPFDPGNSPPNSPKRKNRSSNGKQNPTEQHYPGARVDRIAAHFQAPSRQPFVPQTYQIPRYPDVVGHPNSRYDSSSDEVLVDTSMANMNRPGSIPIINREPRNLEVNRQQVSREPANPGSKASQSRASEHRYPTADYDSSSSAEGLPPSYRSRRRGSSSTNTRQDSPTRGSRAQSASNLRETPGHRVRRDSSERIPEQLKNQRPWSYISASDIPQEPNKLNQFYNNHLVQPPGRSASARALPSLSDDEESDAVKRSTNRVNQHKREYSNTVSSSETRQPLLVETRFPLYAQSKHRDPVYANLQTPPVKKKKNVRFNQRTHSLELLETSFPMETPADSPGTARRYDSTPKKRNKAWRKSGDELCTNEFFFVNYSEQTKRPVGLEAVNPNRTLQLSRQLSSVSSPNLVFDPATNTAHLVFNRTSPHPTQDHCHRQRGCVIHAATCDGQSCANGPWNETSI